MEAYIVYETTNCKGSMFCDFKHKKPTDEEIAKLVKRIRKDEECYNVIINNIIPLWDDKNDMKLNYEDKNVNTWRIVSKIDYPENAICLRLYNEEDGSTSDGVAINLSREEARKLANSLLYYANASDVKAKPRVTSINLNKMAKVKLTEYGEKTYCKFYNLEKIPSEQIDSDGFFRCPLHTLISAFGIDQNTGRPLIVSPQMFVDNNIYFYTFDLKDVTE